MGRLHKLNQRSGKLNRPRGSTPGLFLCLPFATPDFLERALVVLAVDQQLCVWAVANCSMSSFRPPQRWRCIAGIECLELGPATSPRTRPR